MSDDVTDRFLRRGLVGEEEKEVKKEGEEEEEKGNERGEKRSGRDDYEEEE